MIEHLCQRQEGMVINFSAQLGENENMTEGSFANENQTAGLMDVALDGSKKNSAQHVLSEVRGSNARERRAAENSLVII